MYPSTIRTLAEAAYPPLDGSLMFLVTFGSVTIRILGHALLSLLAGACVRVQVCVCKCGWVCDLPNLGTLRLCGSEPCEAAAVSGDTVARALSDAHRVSKAGELA